MWIVIYRPHNKFIMDTQYHGPFEDHADAYDFMCTLPALGIPNAEPDYAAGETDNTGVKYCQELTAPK